MRRIKKVLSTMLVVAMVVGFLPANVNAADNNYQAKVIENSADYKISESYDSEYKYTVILNKIDNTIQLNKEDLTTGDIQYGEETAISVPATSKGLMSAAAVLEQNTFTNYEYTKTYGTTNKWELRRPDSSVFSYYYFKTDETSSNSTALGQFKTYVDQINTLEWQIILNFSLSALSMCVSAAAGAGAIVTGGTLTPAAWAAIATTAGVSANYLNTLISYDSACSNAYDRYWTVYYSSNVYY